MRRVAGALQVEVVRFRMLEGVDGEGGQWRAAIKELLVERVHYLFFLVMCMTRKHSALATMLAPVPVLIGRWSQNDQKENFLAIRSEITMESQEFQFDSNSM